MGMGHTENLLGLPFLDSYCTEMDYMTCQNHFPVLWHCDFPFKITENFPDFALSLFCLWYITCKEADNKSLHQMYASQQYSFWKMNI